MICKAHLVCAAADLALKQGEPLLMPGPGVSDPQTAGRQGTHLETAGAGPVRTALRELEASGRLLRSVNSDLWYAARKSPHREVSLRGTGRTIPIFLENTRQSLGEIDRYRAFFDTHDGAVYLHQGRSYVVTRFDHEKAAWK